MSKNLETLREHLFDTIAGVKAGTVTIEQGRIISDLSQVLVNTAKVEVDFVRATQRSDSPFLAPPKPPAALPNGITGITRHVCKDD